MGLSSTLTFCFTTSLFALIVTDGFSKPSSRIEHLVPAVIFELPTVKVILLPFCPYPTVKVVVPHGLPVA